MQNTLLADRPEEHSGERPTSMAADDKQVGGLARIDEYCCRIPSITRAVTGTCGVRPSVSATTSSSVFRASAAKSTSE